MLNARMAMKALKTRFVDHRPFILSHLLTSRCNADCRTCLWRAPHDAPTDELDLDEIRALYRDAGAAGFNALVVWGGEPLLRPDLAYVLAAGRAARMRTTLITNGWWLEERADELMPHVERLMVSVDALGAAHDEARRRPGLFARMERGLRAVRAAHPGVFVIVNVVLSRLNVDHIEELAEFGRAHGDLVSFQAMNETEYGHVERAIDVEALRLTPEEERRIAAQLADLRSRGHRLSDSDAYLARLGAAPGSYRCHFKKVCLRVEPNGDVLDCTARALPIANVRTTPVADIAGSPAYRDFTKRAEACSRCRDFGVVEISHLWEGRPGSLVNALRNLL